MLQRRQTGSSMGVLGSLIALTIILTNIYYVAHAAGMPPSAVADTYNTALNTPLTVTAPGPLANDSDSDGDPIWITAIIPAQHGVMSQFYSDGRFTYTPEAGYSGVDTIYYQITDGSTHSPVFTTLTINVGVSVGVNMLSNGGFETSDSSSKMPSNWVILNRSADRRVCNNGTLVVSQNDQCAFKFVGAVGEQTVLSQPLGTNMISGLVTGDTLALTLYGRADSANAKTLAVLLVTYADSALGTARIKIKLPRGTITDWRYYTTAPLTLAGAVSSLEVKVTHISTSGTVWLDSLKVIKNGQTAPDLQSAVLALPPAPLDPLTMNWTRVKKVR